VPKRPRRTAMVAGEDVEGDAKKRETSQAKEEGDQTTKNGA
jgi:hypothetical protein